jgi:hypothetical protein
LQRAVPAVVVAFAVIAAAGPAAPAGPGRVPLTDMGSGTYMGFPGGLYPRAANGMPLDHQAAGMDKAAAIVARDAAGNPDPGGKYVLVSIGMSNTTQEFCGSNPCGPGTFMSRAAADPFVDHGTLAIVDGAAGGQTADSWDSPADFNYDRVRDTRLAPRGLSEAQVQVAWVKVANAGPTASLPAANADAYRLVTQTGNIVRALKARYPNLQQVFLSSRIYAGYATTPLNPEPYAYESGFAAKWVIQAQIDQMRTGQPDPRAGDLDYATGPGAWIAWAAYLWADGLNPRSDGLTWAPTDFAADGTHPSASGRAKVGARLLAFFKRSDVARCWFLAGGSCAAASPDGLSPE